MTESAIAANIPPSPLAALLAAAPASATLKPAELTAYRGVLSPKWLDAPQKEWSTLVSGAAVHDLGWLRRVAVRGEDRFRWLNGMVTNSVTGLVADGGAWNLVLNAQGRIQGELYVWRRGNGTDADSIELEVAADQYDKLLAHLDHFIIMDDVELVPLTHLTALGLTGPKADEVLARLSLPILPNPLISTEATWNGPKLQILRSYGALVPHYELWVESAELGALWAALLGAEASPVGTASLETMRVAEAIPTYGVDMVERDLPQETAQTRALHFDKGCYLGQEIVERIRSRGNVHRHLRQLQLDGPLPEPGAELSFENAAGAQAAAGQITSAAELPNAAQPLRIALGMIRGEAELRPLPFTYTVGSATGTARILAEPTNLVL
jgi:folate-binding protein YgfZ